GHIDAAAEHARVRHAQLEATEEVEEVVAEADISQSRGGGRRERLDARAASDARRPLNPPVELRAAEAEVDGDHRTGDRRADVPHQPPQLVMVEVEIIAGIDVQPEETRNRERR